MFNKLMALVYACLAVACFIYAFIAESPDHVLWVAASYAIHALGGTVLRAIPLPDETLWSLKNRKNPVVEFQFRMKLWELDQVLKTDPLDVMINEAEIEHLVTREDCWGRC